MSYEYKNEHGDRLEARKFVSNEVLVKIEHGDGKKSAGLGIPVDEVPALALALLDAAAAVSGLPNVISKARDLLDVHVKESEDTKVCDYFELANGSRPAWGIVSEVEKEECRAEYRRAKRAASIFTKETA